MPLSGLAIKKFNKKPTNKQKKKQTKQKKPKQNKTKKKPHPEIILDN